MVLLSHRVSRGEKEERKRKTERKKERKKGRKNDSRQERGCECCCRLFRVNGGGGGRKKKNGNSPDDGFTCQHESFTLSSTSSPLPLSFSLCFVLSFHGSPQWVQRARRPASRCSCSPLPRAHFDISMGMPLHRWVTLTCAGPWGKRATGASYPRSPT